MTMIEQVARAIYETEPFEATILTALPWADVHESQKVGFRIKARAALEAMREPTPNMIEAVSRALCDPDAKGASEWNRTVRSMHAVHVAMIDAALAEQQS